MASISFLTTTPSGHLALNPADLPSPYTPLIIANPPLTPSHITPSFNPLRLANLVLQLLSMHYQLGMLRRFSDTEDEKNPDRDPDYPSPHLLMLSPEQCTAFLAASRAQDRPFDDAVLEAMCLLPYSSHSSEEFKIAPDTMLLPIPDAEQGAEQELFYYGPRVPRHMLRLTDWWGGDSGMAVFVDTRTGMAIVLEEWEGEEGEEARGLKGVERPVEELLGDWIGRLERLEWVPDGEMNVADNGERSLSHIRHKHLTQRHGWPSSFPLPEPQFTAFLHEKQSLVDTLWASIDDQYRLQTRWADILARRPRSLDNDPHDERLKQIHGSIQRVLRAHAAYQNDVLFAKEAGTEVEASLGSIRGINASGEGWQVELKAEEIWEYFRGVVEDGGERDGVTEELWKVVEEAFEKGRVEERAMRWVDDREL